MSRRGTGLAIVVVGCSLLLTACGGGSSGGAKSSGTRPATTTTSGANTTVPPTTAPTTTAPVTTPPTIAPPTTVAWCRDAVCAVVTWLSGNGHEYAGDCAGTTTDQIPKWCSILRTDGATQKIYAVGPVFSEVAKFLTVTESSGTWTVTAVENPAPLGET